MFRESRYLDTGSNPKTLYAFDANKAISVPYSTPTMTTVAGGGKSFAR